MANSTTGTGSRLFLFQQKTEEDAVSEKLWGSPSLRRRTELKFSVTATLNWIRVDTVGRETVLQAGRLRVRFRWDHVASSLT